MHIWRRKEIENYVLVPDAIRRAIKKGIRGKVKGPSTAVVTSKLMEITEDLKTKTSDAIAEQFQNQSRKGIGLRKASEHARTLLASVWGTIDGRISLVSGMDILKGLTWWSQKEYGVSLTAVRLAANMAAHEIDEEMRIVITAIQHHQPFSFP